jgi:hypothetical protein
MTMDPYEGYQTHFEFDHFDLELVAFSRPANDPCSDYYNLGWRNLIISPRKLQPLEIQLHTLRDCTLKHIRSATIKLSIHHPTSILPTSNGSHL